MKRHAVTLAMLLDHLHAITAPDWLPSPLGAGTALLHLDLHPENVILTQRGPVVIDWPNAARGPGAADVAHTWVVLACSLPTTRIRSSAWSHWAAGGCSSRSSCATTPEPSSAHIWAQLATTAPPTARSRPGSSNRSEKWWTETRPDEPGLDAKTPRLGQRGAFASRRTSQALRINGSSPVVCGFAASGILPDVSLYRHSCRIPLYPIRCNFSSTCNIGGNRVFPHPDRFRGRSLIRPA